jgi:hypothetical protein
MRAKRKKEIEAKWKRLLSRAGKTQRTDSPARPHTMPAGTQVIRRRNGKRDLVIE